MDFTECAKEEKCSIHSKTFVITQEMSIVKQSKVLLSFLTLFLIPYISDFLKVYIKYDVYKYIYSYTNI